jgi:hypothetical protein
MAAGPSPQAVSRPEEEEELEVTLQKADAEL